MERKNSEAERYSDTRKWYIDYMPFVGWMLYEARNNHPPGTDSPHSMHLQRWSLVSCFVLPTLIALGTYSCIYPQETREFVKGCVESILQSTSTNNPKP